MNSIMNKASKPSLIIITSIIIGFLIGYFVNAMVNNSRINELIRMNTEQGFKEKYLSVIEPDKKQEASIDSIISEFAIRNKKLLEIYSDSLENLKLELKRKLDGKLTPSQQRKVSDSKMLMPKNANFENRETQNKKSREEGKIATYMKQDSMSKILIDSLKSRRKEVRAEMIQQRMEEKLDAKTEKLKSELGLNDEQTLALKKIHLRYTMKLNELRKDTTLAPRQKLEKVRNLKQELFAEVKPMLSNQQFERYKEITIETFKERLKEK